MSFAPTLGLLFLGRVIASITGANITAVNAYIADVSPPEDRAKNFGIIGACFGIGFILGPVIGGLLGHWDLRAPFMAAAVLTLCNALYGYFVLPESHPKERRRRFEWARANPLSALGVLGKYPAVLGLTVVMAFDRLAHDALPGTWVLYATYRFQWTELDIGLSLALVGIVFAVVQGGLTGRIVGMWGERKSLFVGLTIVSATYMMYGLATQGWMIYAIIVISGLGGIAGPSLQALITQNVPADEQGGVQGALMSVQAVMGRFSGRSSRPNCSGTSRRRVRRSICRARPSSRVRCSC